MIDRYTIAMMPTAIAQLYRIPRGEVANVTEGIAALAMQLRPRVATQNEEVPNVYQINIVDHIVDYEVDDDKQVIRILFVG